MNTKNIFKLCVIGSLGMATLGLTLVFNPAPAAAHGERSQEPFLRMRTAQWYDTRWTPMAHDVRPPLHFLHLLLLRQRVFWRKGAADLISNYRTLRLSLQGATSLTAVAS
jgi:hypothetical protein